MFLEREAIEFVERQCHEDADTVGEDAQRFRELTLLFGVAAAELRRIGNTPVRGDGVTRPDRSHLARRVVADREDKIHRWRAGLGEFVPAF